MGVEPGVHAFDVESVLAFRQQPQDFGGLEPVQANSALEPVLLAAERRESENRQRLDHRSVNAGVFPGSGGKRRRSGVNDAVSSLAVFGVEKKKKSNGEHSSENPHYHRYTRPKRRKIRPGQGRRRQWRRLRRISGHHHHIIGSNSTIYTEEEPKDETRETEKTHDLPSEEQKKVVGERG